jgi:heme/copper-type cytochrome/quinol oxidase subunit 2
MTMKVTKINLLIMLIVILILIVITYIIITNYANTKKNKNITIEKFDNNTQYYISFVVSNITYYLVMINGVNGVRTTLCITQKKENATKFFISNDNFISYDSYDSSNKMLYINPNTNTINKTNIFFDFMVVKFNYLY